MHLFQAAARDFKSVKNAANGKWPEILSNAGIPFAQLKNHHGPCPGCGGQDRFRFDNLNGDGTFICSQGGLGEIAGEACLALIRT